MFFSRASHIKYKRVVTAIVAAICAFVYFHLTFRYHPPVTVEVRGISNALLELEVFFDSGSGFTSYEHLPLQVVSWSPETRAFLGRAVLPAQPLHQVRLQLKEVGPKVKIASFAFMWADQRVSLDGAVGRSTGALPFDTATHSTGLLALQLALSCFVGWLLWESLALPDRLGCSGWKSTLTRAFRGDGRLVFWIMFAVAVLVHSLWLVAYWPGAMSSDSWNSLFEVNALQFNNWHPYVYALYLMTLMQFARTPAVIGTFQIVVTAGIGAWIVYYCYRNGVRLRYLLPFALLFVFSIPIGLFNIVLWKDVPFSIAVFALSFLVFRAHLIREKAARMCRMPRWSLPLLAILLVLLLHSRHNGAIFYVLVPLFFWKTLPRRQYAMLVAFLLVTYGVVNVAVPRLFEIPRVSGSTYHELRTALAIMTHRNYYSTDRARDIRVVEEFTGESWDWLAANFPNRWFTIASRPRVNYWQFTKDPRPADGFNKGFLIRMISENIPIFMEARTFDFFHSIGLDSSDYDARTNYFEDPLQLQGNNLSPPGQFMWGVSLPAEQKWRALSEVIAAIDGWSRTYDGLFSPLVAVWNLAVYFGLFALILIVERGGSAIALYTLPSLAAAAGVFLIGAGESWRYFYYVYLCGLFVVPLYLVSKGPAPGVER